MLRFYRTRITLVVFGLAIYVAVGTLYGLLALVTPILDALSVTQLNSYPVDNTEEIMQ